MFFRTVCGREARNRRVEGEGDKGQGGKEGGREGEGESEGDRGERRRNKEKEKALPAAFLQITIQYTPAM